jgi:hypothetical protein
MKRFERTQINEDDEEEEERLRTGGSERKAARLLVSSSDGSVKFMSPVSGEVITTGFPVYKDATTVDMFYDRDAGENVHVCLKVKLKS